MRFKVRWLAWLILSHRWMGIVLGLMLLIWSVSGVVLMYYGLPHLTAGERLARLPALDAAAVRISPAEAAARVEGEPFRMRLSMQGDRPAYRIATGRVFGNWSIVYADTGEVFAGFSAEEAIAWLEGYAPEAAGRMSVDGYVTRPDLHTHNPGILTHMPMHRIALNDAAGTIFYVSEGTGEAVMKTDRVGRILGVVGYDLHTWFFFRQQSWWSTLLQVLAWSGFVMALLGVTLGIVRYSLKPRYRLRTAPSRTPYMGLMKWHHLAGLIFGVFAVTWLFSGLVSLSVIPGMRETPYAPAQIAAGARTPQGEGPRLALDDVTAQDVRAAADAAAADFAVAELELITLNGASYWIAYRTPSVEEVRRWSSKSAFDFIAPTLDHDHRLIAARAPEQGTFERLPEETLLAAARRAMPGADVVRTTWLEDYDAYYYDRHPSFDLGLPQPVKTLPVLRVEFDDPLGTWLYLTPSHGQIVKFEAIERANRWGYYGLHGLDIGGLFRLRPLWDVLVITLVGGVGVISATTLLPAWRRLKRIATRSARKRVQPAEAGVRAAEAGSDGG